MTALAEQLAAQRAALEAIRSDVDDLLKAVDRHALPEVRALALSIQCNAYRALR